MQNNPVKSFGVTILVLMAVAAIFAWYVDNNISIVLAVCVLILAILVVVWPAFFTPMYRVWMLFAALIGWVNTRIILFAVFSAVLTPISLILRIFRHDPLLLKKNVTSTWVVRENVVLPESFKRQF